jgi:hypothetical protein
MRRGTVMRIENAVLVQDKQIQVVGGRNASHSLLEQEQARYRKHH